MDQKERYSRQSTLVPAEKLNNYEVSVIGIGAVGRNVSLQLAAMGVQKLHLIDFDKVEESNIASQGYLEGDLGQFKVEATSRQCKAINGSIELRVDLDRFRLKTKVGKIVFCCVDSIETRDSIFRAVSEDCDLFVDGRMQGEVFRVLTAYDKDSREHYVTSIFPEEETVQGSCTAKSTIYCASGLACFEIQAFTKWLRGIPPQKDVLVSLMSNEITVLKE